MESEDRLSNARVAGFAAVSGKGAVLLTGALEWLMIEGMSSKCSVNFVNKEPLSGCVCMLFDRERYSDRHGHLMVFSVARLI